MRNCVLNEQIVPIEQLMDIRVKAYVDRLVPIYQEETQSLVEVMRETLESDYAISSFKKERWSSLRTIITRTITEISIESGVYYDIKPNVQPHPQPKGGMEMLQVLEICRDNHTICMVGFKSAR